MDEIKEYQDGRFLSAGEASWKLLGNNIHWNYPAVVMLPVHLPNEQTYLMEDGAPVNREAVIAAGDRLDKLTGFFALCREEPAARRLIYPDVVRHYSWSAKVGDRPAHWAKRKRGRVNDQGEVEVDTVGRIPMVPLARAEVYHLRLLLFHIKGPVSYEALRTTDEGDVLASFQLACLYHGLIPNDDVFREVLWEVKDTMFGRHLRKLFCTLLVYHRPSDVRALWDEPEVQRSLVEDFRRRSHAQNITEVHVNAALADIEDILDGMGQRMSDFDLPLPNRNLVAAQDHLEVQMEMDHDTVALEAEVNAKYPNLNQEQKAAFDSVVESVEAGDGRVFCLNAGGGTGKTYTVNLILDAVRSKGKLALATATSGIAATLLHGGRTVHSRFKVPIDLSKDSTCFMNRGVKEVCRRTTLIVIDEVTMGHRHMYECLDRSLRDLMSSVAEERGDKLFGGITVLFAGDWRQILPVVVKGHQAQTVDACLLKSYIWRDVVTLPLVTNMRAALAGGGEQDFAQMLDAIGTGDYPSTPGGGPSEQVVQIPQDMLFDPVLPPLRPDQTRLMAKIEALAGHVFFSGNYAHQLDQQLHATPPPEEETLEHAVCNRAIICPLNTMVDQVNACVIKMFPGEAKTYFSSDSLRKEDHGEDYGVELLNTLDGGGPAFPAHKITLKKGCIIMLIRNLDPSEGHCNGTRYVVRNLNRHTIEADIATGAYKGKKLLIPRLKFNSDDNLCAFQFSRVQFPIRLAFGITANKSQGQTYSQIGIYLGINRFFAHGQLYVALSRVGKRENIAISLCEDGSIDANKRGTTTNVVYRQVLREVGIIE